MTDQRKEVINQLHELNILLLHTKLKATRAQTALRAATRVCNVEAARRGVPPLQQLPKSHQTRQRTCLTASATEDLSTLSELLQRIIDNTDTRLLGEEYAERRKAIHEFLMLNHTDTEVQE
ncbi:MAG: MarR family transcriptional regulator [Bifidobacterium sp.]